MLAEALILQICAGLQGQQLEACHKVFEAAGQQTSVARDMKTAEDDVVKQTTARVASVTGEAPMAAALFTAKTVRDKRVEYRLVRNDGYTPDVIPAVSPKNYSINFKWNF